MMQAKHASRKGIIVIGSLCISYLLLMAIQSVLLNAFSSNILAVMWIRNTYNIVTPFFFVTLLAFFTWFYDLHIAWFGGAFIAVNAILALGLPLLNFSTEIIRRFEFGLKNSYAYVLIILIYFAWHTSQKVVAIIGTMAFTISVLLYPIALAFAPTSFVAFVTFNIKSWPIIISSALLFIFLCFAKNKSIE